MARFAPGQSGNPKGRPKGSGSSPAAVLRRSVEAFAPELIETLRKAAAQGDVTAAVALLDRALPKLRSASAAVTLPLDGPRAEAVERILQAVAKGEISAADGAELVTLVDRASGDEPVYVPFDHEKLDKIYERAMAIAEEKRQAVRHRSSPEWLAQFEEDIS